MTLLACALLSGWLTRPLRRMAAAARRAGNGDLDARVPQTRRDEVGELARAFNEMAEGRQELEAARRRLTSDVSHELRTPLTNVRGWLEAAQDGLVATDRQLIDGLHEETLHLQLLVEDLHELAVGDAGGMVLERSPVDLGDLLSQVAASFEARARAAGLSTHIDAALGTLVDADPVRLRQAVANLVANAVRHTPPGGLVTLHATSEVIEVRDTGEGVPAAELPHVFERFRRVDPARGRRTGGSGLGLAIVQQIVTAHGWTVTMTSSQGTDDATPNGTNATSGTTVTIHVRPSATLDPC